jgi:hypothetical protein
MLQAAPDRLVVEADERCTALFVSPAGRFGSCGLRRRLAQHPVQQFKLRRRQADFA